MQQLFVIDSQVDNLDLDKLHVAEVPRGVLLSGSNGFICLGFFNLSSSWVLVYLLLIITIYLKLK